jgi:hypothetical protein
VQFDARKYSYKQHNNIYSACIEPKKKPPLAKKKQILQWKQNEL